MRTGLTLALLLAAVVGLQAVRERQPPLRLPSDETGNVLYVRSPEFLKRAALSYDSLLADLYWIRTVQHYGRTKLSADPLKQYDLLYPLLDLTTSLDPHFTIAYHFGAIFLAEDFPAGADRPDLAIALLEKGLRAQPDRWQFAQDIGFVHYWWRQDYAQAAAWFQKASEMPNAANWLAGVAAVTLAEGGNRQSSRRLWQEIANAEEAEWLRVQARFRLRQLDALDQIAALEQLVARYRQQTGQLPQTWIDLVRLRFLAGIPVDPDRHVYQLLQDGTVTLAPESTLNPLPGVTRPPGAPR